MLETIHFQRKFSCNYYKNKRLSLAEMKFGFLPLTTARGDIYPCLWSTGRFEEQCDNGQYHFLPESSAACARLMGRFNPYSTYDLTVESLCPGDRAGFAVLWEENQLLVYAQRAGDAVDYFCELNGKTEKTGSSPYEAGMHLLFTFHAGVFIEMYCEIQGVIRHVGDIRLEECRCLREEKVFSRADAALYVQGDQKISIRAARNYLDSGIMQADIKPVKYENGEVLIENGRIFLTYTSRYEEEMMQQIASYKLSTSEFNLEGALLFDAGDGHWCGDVASSLVYDRMARKWRIWMCVFSHGHVLAYGETTHDPRFGLNVMDVKPLPLVRDVRQFGGVAGDEDPDFYFDQASGLWYLTICRHDPESKKYRYYLFTSRQPDRGYTYAAETADSLETTGGCFVPFQGKMYFVFGRSFSETSKYDCYSVPDMKKLGELQCNHPDGGFRGWGSVMEIPCGTRRRLLWVTFDRTLGSRYNWSYGNLYFYESETMK